MSKVILLTGCSSGFGYHTAKYLSGQGYTVIPTVRKASDLQILPNCVLLDVTWSQEKINSVTSTLINKYQVIDILINNAGYGLLGQIEDLNEDHAKAQFETNFFGSFKMIKSVLPQMKKQKSGLIINISSILGLFSVPEYGLYSASKFALESLSTALRLEEVKSGIKVVVVNPGSFKTKFARSAQGQDPLIFARLIGRIIKTKNPQPNYLVGREAMIIKIFLSLPQSLKNYLLQKYFS